MCSSEHQRLEGSSFSQIQLTGSRWQKQGRIGKTRWIACFQPGSRYPHGQVPARSSVAEPYPAVAEAQFSLSARQGRRMSARMGSRWTASVPRYHSQHRKLRRLGLARRLQVGQEVPATFQEYHPGKAHSVSFSISIPYRVPLLCI